MPSLPSRNAPCPCGSGRRYKDCHGALASAPARSAAPPDDPAGAATLEATLAEALAHQRAGRLAEAESAYTAALARAPARFDALHMLGVLRYQRGAPEQAAELIMRAIALDDRHAPAHLNLALARIAQDRLDDALASLDRALALDPRLTAAWSSRGNVLAAQGRHEEALACFDRVLATAASDPDALSNRANALLELRRFDEAARDFATLVARRPGYPYALGNLVHCQRQLADWSELPAREQRVVDAVRRGEPAITPLPLLSVTDDAEIQLACARSFAARYYPCSAAARAGPPAPIGRRIRVAYVSGDFRDHAVALLISGLIERHDRRRFEIVGIAFGPDDASPARRRLASAFDRFVDVDGETDDAVAARMRDLQVDIAVDLMGYTAGSRTGVFTRRAAPIQVGYLGFPGTMGSPCFDYLVADDFVVPAARHAAYAERIAWLPGSFQVNDAQRPAAAARPSRAQAGLPADAFVFACFNAVYKIGPAMFDVWMRLLQAVPGAVLWLVVEHPAARENLRSEAHRRGIDPQRLVFAPRAPYPEYLARLPLADLFLDTLPFNAGTTASDALWMGVPVLTCAGDAFAARMAGSLLRAAGLADMITHDLARYEARARALALDAGALRAVRTRLAANRAALPLFDTDGWRAHLEDAFMAMVERHARGEPPQSFAVAARG